MKNLETKINSIFHNVDHSAWTDLKFGDFAQNIVTKVKPKPEDSGKYIGLEHLDSGSIHIRRWGTDIDLKGEKIQMKKGDVIFAKRNAYLRRASVAPFDGICSAHAMVLRPKEEVIDPDFFPFFMTSDYFMDRAIMISVGSLSPTINWPTLAKEVFRLPPLPVQKKITELLRATDDACEKYLVAIDQSYISLQSVFQEKHQDEKAEQVTLEQLALINPTLVEDEARVTGMVDFIPMDAVSEDGEITLDQQKDFQTYKNSLTNFKNGDIIFAKITPCMENGKGAIIEGIKSPVAIGSTEFHVLRPYLKSDLYYLYYLTKLPIFRKLAERHMTGSAGQKRVPTDFLRNYKLKAPSPEIRKNLGMLCHQIWQEKKRCEKQLEVTKALESAILKSFLKP